MSDAITTIDLHGMNCYQARIAIDSLLKKSRDIYYIRVIHGHNYGTELRDFVRAEYSAHPKIIRLDRHEIGVTTLILREI